MAGRLLLELEEVLHSTDACLSQAGADIIGADVKSLMDDCRAKLATIETLVEEATMALDEEEDVALQRKGRAQVEQASRTLKAYKQRYQHLGRRQMELSKQQYEADRALLFSSSKGDDAKQGQEAEKQARARMLDKAKLIDKSRDVTASLRRVKKHIMRELERIESTEKMLEEDSKIMQETSLTQESYQQATDTARRVLSSIERKQRRDELLVVAGRGLFVLVVVYIISKRIPSFLIPDLPSFANLSRMILGPSEEDNDDQGARNEL